MAFPGAGRVCAVLAGTLALLLSAPAMARSAGYKIDNCRACHVGGGNGAAFEVAFLPEQPMPGEQVTLSVTITSSSMKAAGIALYEEQGSYDIPDGEPLRVEEHWVTHTRPKSASNGEVLFQVNWTAPSESGVANFYISTVAANLNGATSGDQANADVVSLAYGCEPTQVYPDADRDGHGDPAASTQLACAETSGFALVADDCDDSNADIHPEASELCNEIDDDCDGSVDNDVVYQTYFADGDADGFGDPGAPVQACAPIAGAVDNATDCHDADASVFPGAIEVCDYVDNNCDGLTDEGVRPSCGVGECNRVSDFCGGACVPGEPQQELCNGLDDDCDGLADEDFCEAGQLCRNGVCTGDPSLQVDGNVSEALAEPDSVEVARSSEPDATGSLGDAGLWTGETSQNSSGEISFSKSDAGGPSSEQHISASVRDAGEPKTLKNKAGKERGFDSNPENKGCAVAPGKQFPAQHWLLFLLVVVPALRRNGRSFSAKVVSIDESRSS